MENMGFLQVCVCSSSGSIQDPIQCAPCPPPTLSYQEFHVHTLAQGLCHQEACNIARRCWKITDCDLTTAPTSPHRTTTPPTTTAPTTTPPTTTAPTTTAPTTTPPTTTPPTTTATTTTSLTTVAASVAPSAAGCDLTCIVVISVLCAAVIAIAIICSLLILRKRRPGGSIKLIYQCFNIFKCRSFNKETEREFGTESTRKNNLVINENQASFVKHAYCERYDIEEKNSDERHTTINVASHQSINEMKTYSQHNVHASITMHITEANTNYRRSAMYEIAQSTQLNTEEEVAIYVLERISDHLDDASTRNESNKHSDEINYLKKEAGCMSQNDQAE